MEDKEDRQMQKPAKKNQEANQEPKLVAGKIVSFVRYGEEILAITHLGTGIRHNYKTKSTQTFGKC